MSLKTEKARESRKEIIDRANDVAYKIKGKQSYYFDEFIKMHPNRKGQRDLVYSVFNGRIANRIITEELEAFYESIK